MKPISSLFALGLYLARIGEAAVASGSVSASITRPSASGRSSSRGSSSIGTASLGTCPPHATSTRTKTSTTYTDNTKISPRTSFTFTEYVSTSTSILYTDLTTYEFIYTSSTTSTVPTTTTVIEEVPHTTTITVPTAAGFTPVLCLPDYLDPTTTITKTVLTEPTLYASVTSPVSIATEYSYTTTSTFSGTYDFPETIYEFPTSTVTSTRTDPTKSVFAACATNNLTPFGPGKNTYIRTRLTLYGGVEQVSVPALDLVDCCAGCQANSTCTGMTAYPPGRFGSELSCFWYIKGEESDPTCNGSFKAMKITPVVAEEPIMYVADSPCGQITTG